MTFYVEEQLLTENVSKCGMACNLCPWSRVVGASMRGDEYETFCQRCKSVLGYRPSKVFSNCVSCRTPDEEIPKGARIPLKNCLIRRCVTRTGIPNCAYCSRFPCDHVKIQGVEWSRERIEARRGRPVSEEEYRIFIEPFEGLRHLQTIRKSLKAEEIQEVATVPPRKVKIVAFPERLSLTPEETAGAQSLHQLLTSIKHSLLGLGDVDTLPSQTRLKNRIRNFLRFLWIFGRFGEFREDGGIHLLVDAKSYIENRGSESGLGTWEFIETKLFKHLPKFGLHGELVELDRKWKTPTGALRKKGWQMKLSFDDVAGGFPALRALQIFTAKLDEKYGKRAFQYFAKADMRVLVT